MYPSWREREEGKGEEGMKEEGSRMEGSKGSEKMWVGGRDAWKEGRKGERSERREGMEGRNDVRKEGKEERRSWREGGKEGRIKENLYKNMSSTFYSCVSFRTVTNSDTQDG